MVDSNNFLYNYEATVTAGDVTVDFSSETGLPASPVALIDDPSPNGLLSAGEAGFFEGSDIDTSGFVYIGRFSQGATEAVVVEVSGEYFVYSTDQLTDPGGAITYLASDYVLCFVKGTSIRTPSGDRCIEDLAVGDSVIASDGVSYPIRWIGRLKRISGLDPQFMPVKIMKNSFEDGVPSRDLYVSPDHAVLLSGYLVTARSLINDSSVRWAEDLGPVTEYFHLELDEHRVIFANDAPTESYLDEVPRDRFDNWSEWEQLGRSVMKCEPLPYLRVKSRRQLPKSIAEFLLARAIGLGLEFKSVERHAS